MNEGQREALVELLLCAADLAFVAPSNFTLSAAHRDLVSVGYDSRIFAWACDVRAEATNARLAAGATHNPWLSLLEAAARVEEGSWP